MSSEHPPAVQLLDQPLRINWVAPVTAVDSLSKEVLVAGGVVDGQREFVPRDEEASQYLESSFEPLTVLVCTVAAIWAAERVMRILRLANHNGLVIEDKETGVEIREQPALAPGTVLDLRGKNARFLKEPHSTDIVKIFTALAAKFTPK